ncbi:MAG: DNA repair protein RadC [Acholeplasmatales bacterium]|jgi:DNA repair protein RadC|nr:DNA repair protein RadC [Acholeplasmatales bacterium]
MINKNDMPRERLLKIGPSSLSNCELLMILLKTGNKKENVRELSNNIIDKLSTLKDIQNLNANELMQINGIKQAKACTILASIELGKRLIYSEQDNSKIKIKELVQIYNLFCGNITSLNTETVMLFCLDSKMKLIKVETLSSGSISQVFVDHKVICKICIRYNTKFVFIAHNHPSGESQASESDINFTVDLKQYLHLLDIDLLDHLVIGDHEYYSIVNDSTYIS